jgi:lysophospholipase L1-like esterase
LQGSALLLGSLLLCEAAARFVFPEPEVHNFNRIQFTLLSAFGGLDEVSKSGGLEPEASFSYAERRPLRNVVITWASDPDGMEVPVELNLYGFRGPDFRIAKPAGKRRVIFLGDSFVEGFGVTGEATIPEVFRREIGAEDLEVLNLGVGGANLPEIADLARIAIPLLSPDHVVLVMYRNDLPSQPLDMQVLSRPFVPVGTRAWPRLLTAPLDLWRGNTPALFYHRGPYPFFRAAPHPSNPRTDADDDGVPPELAAAMRAGRLNPFLATAAPGLEARLLLRLGPSQSARPHLRYIQEVCQKQGASLLVGYIPESVTVSDHYRRYWEELGARFQSASLATPDFRQQQVTLAGVARDLHIPFVDTTAELVDEEAKGRRLYFGYDTHMNEAGYALVARALARRFEQEWGP